MSSIAGLTRPDGVCAVLPIYRCVNSSALPFSPPNLVGVTGGGGVACATKAPVLLLSKRLETAGRTNERRGVGMGGGSSRGEGGCELDLTSKPVEMCQPSPLVR
jgi:hypothetical protein